MTSLLVETGKAFIVLDDKDSQIYVISLVNTNMWRINQFSWSGGWFYTKNAKEPKFLSR